MAVEDKETLEDGHKGPVEGTMKAENTIVGIDEYLFVDKTIVFRRINE